MKILAFADTHFGYTTGRTKKARERIVDHFFNQFLEIKKQAIRQDVNYILHGGDVFNRSNPPKSMLKRFYSIVGSILDQGIGFIVIPGNHDKARLPPSLLEYYYPNFHAFNKFSRIELDGIQIIGFPFEYDSPKSVLEQVRKEVLKNDNTPSLLLCHQLFEGSRFGPQEHIFWRGDDVLNINSFPSNFQVITGHIHQAQSVFGGRVVYPGSIARTSFAEIIEPKGYLIIEMEQDYITIEFKQLNTLPMEVIEVELNGKFDLTQIEDQLPSATTRTLLRIVNSELNKDTIDLLWSHFEADNWPYLQISPRTPSLVLQSLYTDKNREFKFSDILRSY